jgi:hypothetical protein
VNPVFLSGTQDIKLGKATDMPSTEIDRDFVLAPGPPEASHTGMACIST